MYFFNTRSDRQYRTVQLLSLIHDKIIPDKLIIKGDKLDSLISRYDFESMGIEVIRFGENSKPDSIIDYIGSLDNYLVIGVGNIVGWGDIFVQEMKRYKVND